MACYIYIPCLLFLVNSNHSECEKEWEKIYESGSTPLSSSRYSKMYQASGLSLNKIGDYNMCNNIEYAKYAVLYWVDIPRYALTFCGPEICTLEDYKNFTSGLKISNKDPVIVFPKEFQEENYKKYTTGAIVMIIFISFIVILAAISTVIDLFVNDVNREFKIIKYLLCFSIKANGQILLSTNRLRNGNKDPLEILNSIRVLSLGWIILGHVCVLIIKKAVITNYNTIIDKIESFEYTFVFTLYYTVNTFFWISGLLMSFLLLISIEKQKKMTLKDFFMIYVHRYLRLTPLAMFILFFLWTLTEYLGNGPLWIDARSSAKDCEKYWYTNLIYLNNFIPDFTGSKCFSIGWYLAVDMQCYCVFPIVIIIYTKYKREAGWVIILILCIIGIIYSGITGYILKLSPSHLSSNSEWELYTFEYATPHAHIGPYSLGVACGFIIYSYRKYQDTQIIYDKFALYLAKKQEKIYIRTSVFTAGLLLINIIFFATYDLYNHTNIDLTYTHWNLLENVLYIAFENFVFTLGISLVLLPILLGHFRLFISIMSLYPWNILAKLSYAGYLVNYYLIIITYESQKTSLMLSNYENLKNIIYFFIMSLILSIPLFLFIESPASNLEKLFFEKKKREKDERFGDDIEIKQIITKNSIFSDDIEVRLFKKENINT